jgi:arylsulfatase A
LARANALCRLLLVSLLLLPAVGRAAPRDAGAPRPPNVVIVFTDDQGWGDLSCYGQTGFATPAIDQLATEGMRFTDFYAAQPVCSASRAALLTGCYPNRIGISGALGPAAKHGLHPDETTIAELVKPLGYATAIFGKWHLGHLPPFLPTKHGFDRYEGLPYSNDMWPGHPETPKAWPPLPWIVQDEVGEIIEDFDDQETITNRLTDAAVEFIETQEKEPFLLYLAHPMPHVPLGVSPKFRHTTRYGVYGDVIREIDHSVGRLRSALERTGVLDDTIFIFTSDNGPWLSYGDHAGTTGGLREGKGTTFEGGVRVPCVVRYPRLVPAGSVSRAPWMTIDVLPTIAEILGTGLPEATIDGRSVVPIWRGDEEARSPQEAYFFWYHRSNLEAMRSGRWKLHFPHKYRTVIGEPPANNGLPTRYDYGARIGLSLFDLEADPNETTDVSAAHPEVVARLTALADAMRARLGDRLTEVEGNETRPPGRVGGE